MRLEKDFIKILKDRNFNYGEYEQIGSYLSMIRSKMIAIDFRMLLDYLLNQLFNFGS